MFIDDLNKSMTARVIGNIIQETFDFELSEDILSLQKAKDILEDVCIQINDFRNSKQYFLGERNATYLSMLATAKYLTEYLREKKTLLEEPTTQMYHQGIKKGIGHGVDTATKFVPHVAGSAIGAFVGGLKGQALSSEHGRIKIANIDIDKEFDKHFGEYKDPNTKKVIKNYMSSLQKAGLEKQNLTPQIIEQQLANLPGKPFKNVTDPKIKKEMIDYFMNIATSAKAPTSTDKLAGRGVPLATTQVMKDTASALLNLGYKKQEVGIAIKNVVNKDAGLASDFDALFKSALAVIKK
jgi:hypothetical protein